MHLLLRLLTVHLMTSPSCMLSESRPARVVFVWYIVRDFGLQQSVYRGRRPPAPTLVAACYTHSRYCLRR